MENIGNSRIKIIEVKSSGLIRQNYQVFKYVYIQAVNAKLYYIISY